MNSGPAGLNTYYCNSGYQYRGDEPTEAYSDEESEDDGSFLKSQRKDVTQVLNGQLSSIRRRLASKLHLKSVDDITVWPSGDVIKIVVKGAWDTNEVNAIIRQCVVDEYRLDDGEVRTVPSYDASSGKQDKCISVVVSFDTKKFISDYLRTSKWGVTAAWAVILIAAAVYLTYTGGKTFLVYFT